MGQGLYRCAGWGCLNPPSLDWDSRFGDQLLSIVRTESEAEPGYIMIPFAVDDKLLQVWWSLAPLPKGLPHIEPRTAVSVPQCQWWPDYGKAGVWVSDRLSRTWELLREIARDRGIDLPEGEPLFVCDWD